MVGNEWGKGCKVFLIWRHTGDDGLKRKRGLDPLMHAGWVGLAKSERKLQRVLCQAGWEEMTADKYQDEWDAER